MKPLFFMLVVCMVAGADVAPRRDRINPAGLAELSNYVLPGVWTVTPGGKYVVTKVMGGIEIFESRTGKSLGKLDGHADVGIHDGGWSANGRTIATAGSNETVKVWDVGTMKELASFTPHAQFSCSVTVSPDGRLLATGGGTDGSVKIHDIAAGRELKCVAVTTGNVYMIQFDATGKNVVCCGGPDRAFRAIEIETGKVTLIDDRIGHVQGVDFSSDGRYMTAVTGAAVVVWDAKTWKEVRRIEGRFGPRSYAAFSMDGSFVASTELDGSVRIWEVSTGKLAANLGFVGSPNKPVKFSADRQSVIVPGSDDTMRVFGPTGTKVK